MIKTETFMGYLTENFLQFLDIVLPGSFYLPENDLWLDTVL